MTTAVVLQTADELGAVRQRDPAVLQDCLVVGLASGLALGQAVREAGLTFRPYTDFVSEAQFVRAMDDALAASKAWFAELVGEAADPDLLECTRLEVLQALAEMFLAQRVITRLLDEVAPDQVIWTNGMDARIAAIVEFEVDRRDVVGCCVELQVPAGRARHRSLASRLVRYGLSLAHDALVLAGHGLAQCGRRLPTVLCFGAGVDAVNQQRVLPLVGVQARVRPLLVQLGDVRPNMRNRPPAEGRPALHFLPLAAMLCTVREKRRCEAWWHAFRRNQSTYRGPNAFLFANPRLAFFWKRILLHLFPHALATRRDVCGMLRLLRPSLVLISNDVSFPVRSLVLAAHRRGLPTVGLIHSGLNNLLYRDFRTDLMAVWGPVHVRDFQTVLGKHPSQLVAIGNPQYDSLTAAAGASAGSEAGRRPKTARRGRKLPAGNTTHHSQLIGGDGPRTAAHVPRVLVLTAVPQWYMFYIDQARHLAAWRELQQLPDYGVNLTVKPHPRFDDYAFYASLGHPPPDWREEKAGISLASHAFLEEVAPLCDVVVVPGYPTTAAIEAMLFHKPVVYLQCGFEGVEFCESIASGCLVVREVDQVCRTILGLLGDAEKQAELVRRGQHYLDDFLGQRDGRAADRLAGLIAQMAGGAGRGATGAKVA